MSPADQKARAADQSFPGRLRHQVRALGWLGELAETQGTQDDCARFRVATRNLLELADELERQEITLAAQLAGARSTAREVTRKLRAATEIAHG